MAADNEARVPITGDDAGLKAAVASAHTTLKSFASNATGEFERVQASAAKLSTVFVGMGAAILAGGAFKAVTDQTVALTKEATSLGKALGITTTEASVLNVALGDIYTDADTLIAANNKLTKALKDNEAGFAELGVATRDGNGQFRNSLDVMLDVNKRLLEFREGTDRNIEGQKIYGKSWGEIQPVLKLTTDLMEESRHKAQQLGLVIGEENVQATAKYRAALNDVGDVMMAAKKVVGDAVLPILTDLGVWFAETGPTRIEYTRKAVGVAVAAFYGFKTAVETVLTIVKGMIQSTAVYLLTFAEAASQALRLDFSGATAAWQRGMDQIRNMAGDTMDKMVADATVNRDKMFAALYTGFEGPIVTATKQKGAGAGSSGGKDGKEKAEKSRVSEFENELDLQKLAHERLNVENNTFIEFAKQRERDFWKSILERQDLSAQERMQVEKKYLTSVQAIRKDDYDAYIAGLKTQMEAFQNDQDRRGAIARRVQADTIARYGAHSKEAEAAAQAVIAIERKKAEQLAEIDRLRVEAGRNQRVTDIDLEQKDADLSLALSQITQAQHIQMLRDFARRRMEIELETIATEEAAQRAKNDRDIVALEKLEQQKAEVRRRHQVQDKELENKGTIEGNKPFQGIFAGLQQTTAIMLNQQRNAAQQVLQIWRNMAVQWVAQVVGRMVQQWVLGELLKTQATTAGTAARSAAEQAGASESMLMQAAGIIKKIFNFAAEAFAGTFAFLSGTMGPAAAGPAAAAMGAVNAIAGSVVASAARGFDIPKNTNPLTQLHEQEMVLPAPLANAVRAMAAGGQGGGGGGGGGEGSFVFAPRVTTFDARSFEQWMRVAGPQMARAMANQARNFNKGGR
jgi:hypothetical protein